MNTFKEGDRVIHKTYGEGTVVFPYEGLSSITVEFDTEGKIMTDKSLLTPVPSEPKFKIGDRVSHRLHPDGVVEDYSEVTGLYTVDIGGGRGFYALEDQLRVPKPEPKFNVRVMFTNGNEVNAGVKFQQQAESYLSNFSNWDSIESITINRVKG